MMRGPTAAATAAAVLLLQSTPGVASSWATPTERVVHSDNSRAGGGLRGVSQAAIIEADRSAGNKMSTLQQFTLLETCLAAEDCAPGLFVVSKCREKTQLLAVVRTENKNFGAHRCVYSHPFAVSHICFSIIRQQSTCCKLEAGFL